MNRVLVFIASVGVAFVMISFTASANASGAMASVHASTSRQATTASADGGAGDDVISWGVMPPELLSGSALETL